MARLSPIDTSLSAALQVVARHREHGAYGSHAKLLKAVQRRVRADEDAVSLLNRATALYDAAVEVAAQHVSALWASRTGGPLIIPAFVRDQLREVVPGELEGDYDETLSWIFYTYHLR